MSNFTKALLITLLSLFSVNAYAQKKSTGIEIKGVRFMLPGDWKRTADYEEAGQYGFTESKTGLNIAIAIRNHEKDEYYKPGMKGFELVNAFYTWDSEYWASDIGVKATVKKLKEDTVKNLIFWSINTPKDENIFLFGLRDERLISINLNNTNENTRMTEPKAMEFLESILFSYVK